MKTRITLGAVLAIALVASVLAGAWAQDQEQQALQPKMVIPQVRYDFGDVFEQESYECEFVVRNQGKADLVIENVKPG